MTDDPALALATFKTGDRVETRTVDNRLSRPGVVVSVFQTIVGEVRYVVEHGSALRIYRAGQLRARHP